MTDVISSDDLYEIFDYDHHFTSAVGLFEFLRMHRPLSVILSPTKQGKSQFLFFLVKLLQELGEIVLFLDRTIIPYFQHSKCNVKISQFWNSTKLSEECKLMFCKFQSEPTTQNFEVFLWELGKFAKKGNRVWVIMDDDKMFPIHLPEEQRISPFHWIVTGGEGIGSWVSKRHLEKFTFDLPLFSADATLALAEKLSHCLRVDLTEAIGGTPEEGLRDWLDEKFGGNVGFVTELFFEIRHGHDINHYLSGINELVDSHVFKAAGNGSHMHYLPQTWLLEMKSRFYTSWRHLSDTGLCGSSPPRDIILPMILEELFLYCREGDSLLLIENLRTEYWNDPGLHGCLLKFEVILKLQRGMQFTASYVVPENDRWIVPNDESVLLPAEQGCNRWFYKEASTALINITEKDTQWHLVEFNISSWFDVVDAVLVNCSEEVPTIYGIKITRLTDPFQKHHTLDTCTGRCKERLDTMWEVIGKKLNFENPKIVFTMIAPNCEDNDKFMQPRAGQVHPYYISQATEFFNYWPGRRQRLRNHLARKVAKRKA
jgi:hypothetical protein